MIIKISGTANCHSTVCIVCLTRDNKAHSFSFKEMIDYNALTFRICVFFSQQTSQHLQDVCDANGDRGEEIHNTETTAPFHGPRCPYRGQHSTKLQSSYQGL